METDYGPGQDNGSQSDSINIGVQPSPQASQPSAGNANPQQAPQIKLSPSGIAFKAISAIIVLALVSYLAYYFIHSASASSNPVIAMLSTHKPVSLVSVANTMLNYVNKTKQLNVSYNGIVTLVISTTFTGNMTVSMPIKFSYQKYYNISRMSASLKDIPFAGNMSFVSITNKSVHYSCSNMSSMSLITGKSGFVCTKNVSSSTASVVPTNISAIEKKLNLNVEGVKQASYNGQPCYIMTGKGVANIPSNLTTQSSLLPAAAPTNFTYNITSCVSLQYGIPLNLSMSIGSTNKTSPMKVSIALNEVGLNTNTGASIGALPGPIENASSLLTGGLGSSGLGSSGASWTDTTTIMAPSLFCVFTVGYSCTNQSLVGNRFSAMLEQTTGNNWPYAVLCLTSANYTRPITSVNYTTPSYELLTSCPQGSVPYVLANGFKSGVPVYVSFNASRFITNGNISAQIYVLYGNSSSNITGNAYIGFVTGSGPAYTIGSTSQMPTTTISSISTSPQQISNQSSYQYSGIYNGSVVVLTYTQPRTIEALPDASYVGVLTNFYTNNPKYQCLNGEALNVWVAPSEYPGYYIVHNGGQGSQCAYVTLLFKQ